MIITKKHLSRRTVLRGLGRVAGAAAARQHGSGADRARQDRGGAGAAAWRVLRAERHVDAATGSRRPKGRSTELPPTLAVAAANSRTACCCCGGLADEPANLVKGGGDHARSAGTFLTGVPFKFTSGADVFGSVSMDQIAAQEFAKETQLASLELGIESNAMLGSCDGGSSCAYTNTIAWRTPTTPLPIENDPRAVFERLFGTSGSTDQAARLARIKRDQSILDFVGDRDRPASSKLIGPQRQDQGRPSTSTRCATSSGASRWPRSRTRASCRSSISRSACRPTTPSTPS